MMRLSLVVFFSTTASWIQTTPLVSANLEIDCGCPNTCTTEALNEWNGSPYSCRKRIAWLMTHRDLPQANACAAASFGYPGDPGGDADSSRPCRYEACHPIGCGSTLPFEEDFQLLHNCGCPDSCTDAVMAETFPGQQWSCFQRVHYMVHFHKNFEYDACTMAADEGFCNAQACRPDLCGSTLEKTLPLDCGCPQTCTEAVLDEKLSDKRYTCRERLEFMIDYHKNEQWDACFLAAQEGYCDVEKCRPDFCGSSLVQPTNPVVVPPPPAPEVTAPPPAPEVTEPPPPEPQVTEPSPESEVSVVPPAPEVPETTPEDNTPTDDGDNTETTPEESLMEGINAEIKENEQKHTGGGGKGIFSHPSDESAKEEGGLTATTPETNTPVDSSSSQNENNNNNNNNDSNKSSSSNVLPILMSFLMGGIAAGLLFFYKSHRNNIDNTFSSSQTDPNLKVWGRRNSLPCVSPRSSFVDNKIVQSSYKDLPLDDDVQTNAPLWDDSIKQAQIEMKRMGIDSLAPGGEVHDYDYNVPNPASRYRDVPTNDDVDDVINDIEENYAGGGESDNLVSASEGRESGSDRKKKKKKKGSSKMKKMAVKFDQSAGAADDEFPASPSTRYSDLDTDDSIDLPSFT